MAIDAAQLAKLGLNRQRAIAAFREAERDRQLQARQQPAQYLGKGVLQSVVKRLGHDPVPGGRNLSSGAIPVGATISSGQGFIQALPAGARSRFPQQAQRPHRKSYAILYRQTTHLAIQGTSRTTTFDLFFKLGSRAPVKVGSFQEFSRNLGSGQWMRQSVYTYISLARNQSPVVETVTRTWGIVGPRDREYIEDRVHDTYKVSLQGVAQGDFTTWRSPVLERNENWRAWYVIGDPEEGEDYVALAQGEIILNRGTRHTADFARSLLFTGPSSLPTKVITASNSKSIQLPVRIERFDPEIIWPPGAYYPPRQVYEPRGEGKPVAWGLNLGCDPFEPDCPESEAWNRPFDPSESGHAAQQLFWGFQLVPPIL